ncbi:MAG TPA: type III-B CRISPR module RAMP protein Cmr1 [Lentisphaeria bacterium]|nr:MAG: type III-B CRISPR module RAMP protein Cmr1 [Lentisphaerae bacterium GWF2_38_69]HBM15078.1 type III-B CRISPR module RAMP protein Cmr1 [Lentisphaeria bacterium]
MDRAKVKFTFVTPCITSGADQRKAELRIPSIRGQLRWWMRTLGYEESVHSILGGIDSTGNAISSSFIIRDCTENKIKTDVLERDRSDYFLWPIRNKGYIYEDEEIHIEIIYRYRKDASDFPDEVLKIFLLLGSLGTRSRRAYGSIYPTSVEIDGISWDIPKDIASFKKEIYEILKGLNCKVLLLSQSQQRWQDAVGVCASFLKEFRCGSTRYGQTPSKWGKYDHDLAFKGDTIYRASIGMPLKTKYYEAKINDFDRLASPVHFKVIKLGNGFYPISIIFPDHALKEGLNVRVGLKNVKLSHDLLYAMMDADNVEVLFDS